MVPQVTRPGVTPGHQLDLFGPLCVCASAGQLTHLTNQCKRVDQQSSSRTDRDTHTIRLLAVWQPACASAGCTTPAVLSCPVLQGPDLCDSFMLRVGSISSRLPSTRWVAAAVLWVT
jgi:hypothetical protein